MSEAEYLRLSDIALKLENSKRALDDRLKKVKKEMEIAKEAIIQEYLEDGVVPFSLIVKKLPPKPVVIDEYKIPEKFWLVKREINKLEINKAFGKEPIDGVILDNGGYTVAIKAQNAKATENQE